MFREVSSLHIAVVEGRSVNRGGAVMLAATVCNTQDELVISLSLATGESPELQTFGLARSFFGRGLPAIWSRRLKGRSWNTSCRPMPIECLVRQHPVENNAPAFLYDVILRHIERTSTDSTAAPSEALTYRSVARSAEFYRMRCIRRV